MKQFNLHQFRDRFNQARDFVKLLTVFSPTCLLCQYGQGVIRELYENIDARMLKGFSIWLPIMDGDNSVSAEEQSAKFPVDRHDSGKPEGENLRQSSAAKPFNWEISAQAACLDLSFGGFRLGPDALSS